MRPLALTFAVCLTIAACGGSSSTAAPGVTATHTVSAIKPKPKPKLKPRPKPKPKPEPRANPGALPQTNQLPSSETPGFHEEMAALWRGVVQGSMRAALPAFFPEGAYVQVKAIADPRADYVARLLGGYRLDIAAAHALLGPQHQAAKLLGVRVPGSYAHWISPGVCYNRVGYYEVPNARVVYQLGGGVHSFGIASMISWRGVWYVVHLGAVVRSTAAGVVDDPSSGPGESIPSSTC